MSMGSKQQKTSESEKLMADLFKEKYDFYKEEGHPLLKEERDLAKKSNSAIALQRGANEGSASGFNANNGGAVAPTVGQDPNSGNIFQQIKNKQEGLVKGLTIGRNKGRQIATNQGLNKSMLVLDRGAGIRRQADANTQRAASTQATMDAATLSHRNNRDSQLLELGGTVAGYGIGKYQTNKGIDQSVDSLMLEDPQLF